MPKHHSPRPQLYSQKTKDALAALPELDHLTAARIVNVRTSPIGTVTKQDLGDALFALYDAVRPIVESIHAIDTRRSIAETLDTLVRNHKASLAAERSQTISNE